MAHSCCTRPFETIKNECDCVLRTYFYKGLAQEFEYLFEYLYTDKNNRMEPNRMEMKS